MIRSEAYVFTYLFTQFIFFFYSYLSFIELQFNTQNHCNCLLDIHK